MDSWLSLSVSQKKVSTGSSNRVLFHIAVPKKVVNLATRRNRIKRLIREAVRRDDFFSGGTIYTFRIKSAPAKLNLSVVQQAVNKLK